MKQYISIQHVLNIQLPNTQPNHDIALLDEDVVVNMIDNNLLANIDL